DAELRIRAVKLVAPDKQPEVVFAEQHHVLTGPAKPLLASAGACRLSVLEHRRVVPREQSARRRIAIPYWVPVLIEHRFPAEPAAPGADTAGTAATSAQVSWCSL